MNSVKTTMTTEHAHGVTGRLDARTDAGSDCGSGSCSTGMVAAEGATFSYDFNVGAGSKAAAGSSAYQVGCPTNSIHMFIGVEGE